MTTDDLVWPWLAALLEPDEAVCIYGILCCMASSVLGGGVAVVVKVLSIFPETVDDLRRASSSLVGSSVCIDYDDLSFSGGGWVVYDATALIRCLIVCGEPGPSISLGWAACG